MLDDPTFEALVVRSSLTEMIVSLPTPPARTGCRRVVLHCMPHNTSIASDAPRGRTRTPSGACAPWGPRAPCAPMRPPVPVSPSRTPLCGLDGVLLSALRCRTARTFPRPTRIQDRREGRGPGVDRGRCFQNRHPPWAGVLAFGLHAEATSCARRIGPVQSLDPEVPTK